MTDFFNFSDAPTEQMGSFELIPEGTKAFAIFTIREPSPGIAETPSKSNPNNAYLDVELTITHAPYAKRKIFDRIGVRAGQDEKGQKWVNMGRASIRAILEAGNNASTTNPTGYQISKFQDLNGLKVAIEIGIEEGTDGYQDKNIVKAYLSPNPDSNTHKKFLQIQGVDNVGQATNAAAPAAQQAAPVQQQQQATPSGGPDWLNN